MVAESDGGALYDTRGPGWSSAPPLRRPYSATYREISNLAELKATLRAGGFAWPGGYPLYFIAADGETVAFETVRAEFRRICREYLDAAKPGAWPDKAWLIAGCQINYEDGELYCAHSNARIESAYAEPEPEPGGVGVYIWQAGPAWHWLDSENHGGFDSSVPAGPFPSREAAETDAREIMGETLGAWIDGPPPAPDELDAGER